MNTLYKFLWRSLQIHCVFKYNAYDNTNGCDCDGMSVTRTSHVTMEDFNYLFLSFFDHVELALSCEPYAVIFLRGLIFADNLENCEYYTPLNCEYYSPLNWVLQPSQLWVLQPSQLSITPLSTVSMTPLSTVSITALSTEYYSPFNGEYHTPLNCEYHTSLNWVSHLSQLSITPLSTEYHTPLNWLNDTCV